MIVSTIVSLYKLVAITSRPLYISPVIPFRVSNTEAITLGFLVGCMVRVGKLSETNNQQISTNEVIPLTKVASSTSIILSYVILLMNPSATIFVHFSYHPLQAATFVGLSFGRLCNLSRKKPFWILGRSSGGSKKSRPGTWKWCCPPFCKRVFHKTPSKL